MRVYGLALVASAVVLGACGGGGDKTTVKTDTAATAATSTTATTTVTTTTPTAGAVAKKPATRKTVEIKKIGHRKNYKIGPANKKIKKHDNAQQAKSSEGPP